MTNPAAQDTNTDMTETTLVSRTGLAYFPLAFMARLPFAMMVIGVLTLVVAARGSVQIAGLSSALVGIGAATIGPLVGASADRFGQRPTLLVTAIINSVALCALAWIAYSGLPSWLMFLAAFITGASGPQTSPMSRSRLVGIIMSSLPTAKKGRTISTVLAYESAVDEVVFVFGPVIVGLLATTLGGWAPIIGAAILTLVFVIAFALHHTSTPALSKEERARDLAPTSELFRPSLSVIVIGTFAVGLVFGTTFTALTAFMQEKGSAESAGLLYGVMGIGSAILALAVALLPAGFTMRYRWLAFASFVVIGEILFTFADSVPTVLLSLAVTGVGIGPMLVTLYGFGTERSPRGRSATVMTMLGSGILLGQSLAAALTGAVAQGMGVSTAMTLPAFAALLVIVTGTLNWFLTPSKRALG